MPLVFAKGFVDIMNLMTKSKYWEGEWSENYKKK